MKWKEEEPSDFRARYLTPLGLCFLIYEMGVLKPAFWGPYEGLRKTGAWTQESACLD